MNKYEIEGNWLEQKERLKQRFAHLTEDDLMFEEGMKDEMIRKLQMKPGKTNEELRRIITNL